MKQLPPESFSFKLAVSHQQSAFSAPATHPILIYSFQILLTADSRRLIAINV